MTQDMFGRRLARRLGWLKQVEKVQPFVRRTLSRSLLVRDALDGTWLGTPLHPVLTDVPVGSATAALVLDSAESVSGSRRLGTAADSALVVSVAATLPAAVTGTADWRDLIGEPKRVATLHALLNVAGLALNACSVVARARGRRGLGKAASAAGLLVTAVSAHIGGELSFGLGVRVNQDIWHEGPAEFTDVLDEAELEPGRMKRVEVAGVPVLVARTQSGEPCAISATCSHAGGPLDEGSREGDRVVCPWHGSCFDLRTGAVVHGPAVFSQPHYETRVQDGRIAVRQANP